MTAKEMLLPTRELSLAIQQTLAELKPGQRIRIIQSIRVGDRQWTTTVEGVFRNINYLATGLSTDRLPEDDIVMPTVHFAKDNGELSSIALDENTKVSVI
jgi:hypothetical protein